MNGLALSSAQQRPRSYTSGPRDVVFPLGFITWAEGDPERGVASAIVARHLVSCLLEDRRVGRVLVADPARSFLVRLARRDFASRPVSFPDTEEAELYRPLRFRRDEADRLRTVERAYLRYDNRLRRRAARLGLSSPVVITTSPFVAGFAPLTWAGPVTYYARDDYAAATATAHQQRWSLYTEAYSRMSTLERQIASVSPAIIDEIQPRGKAVVSANGVNPLHWIPKPAAHPAMSGFPGPRLVYVGGLDDRLDVEMVRATAARHPQGSVVIVGRHIDPTHLDPLREVPNVALFGWASRSEAASLIATADAGILPHRLLRGTRAMSPLKVYEYLAGGLPVATVDIPGVRGISDRVIISESPADFPDAVEAALAKGRANENERRQFVKENSWRARHTALIDLALGTGGD